MLGGEIIRTNKAKNIRLNRGFTLVELLISLALVVILVGLLMHGFGQMSAKVTTTKIIADLRTLRSAIAMYHLDKGSWPEGGAGTWDVLKPYIDSDTLSSTNPTNADQPKIYATRVIQSGVNKGRIFIVANVNDNQKLGINSSVRSKLEKLQAEFGLLNNSFNAYKKTSMIVMVEVKR